MQLKAVGKRLLVSFCSPLVNSFRFREAYGVHLLHLSPELNSLKLSLEPTVNFSAPRRKLQAHLTGLKSHGLRLSRLYLEEDGSQGNSFKSCNHFFPFLSNFCCSALVPHHWQSFKNHSRGPRSSQVELISLYHLFYSFSCLYLCNPYVCGLGRGNWGVKKYYRPALQSQM